MGTTITEPVGTGEFLLSEAAGYRSREQGVLLKQSLTFASGTVLGQVTITRKFDRLNPDAEDGTEKAAAILYTPVEPSTTDTRVVVVDTDAEVNGHLLSWPDDITDAARNDAIADLNAVGIKVR